MARDTGLPTHAQGFKVRRVPIGRISCWSFLPEKTSEHELLFVESVGAREAGARVATNVLVGGLDLLVPTVRDGRRWEIVAEGLPLLGGVQLVVDTTLVSPSRCDGSHPSQRCHQRRCGSPGLRWGSEWTE